MINPKALMKEWFNVKLLIKSKELSLIHSLLNTNKKNINVVNSMHFYDKFSIN